MERKGDLQYLTTAASLTTILSPEMGMKYFINKEWNEGDLLSRVCDKRDANDKRASPHPCMIYLLTFFAPRFKWGRAAVTTKVIDCLRITFCCWKAQKRRTNSSCQLSGRTLPQVKFRQGCTSCKPVELISSSYLLSCLESIFHCIQGKIYFSPEITLK